MSAYRKIVIPLWSYIFLILFGIAGCLKSIPPPDSKNPIARVAVLPLHNKTENVKGCECVRQAFIDLVRARHYWVMSPGEVDRILQDKFGITLGGQLDFTNPSIGAPSPQDVGEALGVDGVLYGTLEEFNYLYLLYYEDRRVEVKFVLIDSKTGLIVWEKEARSSNTYSSLNKLFNPFEQGLAGKMLSDALGRNPLQDETDEVMKKIGKTLPSGPGYVGPR